MGILKENKAAIRFLLTFVGLYIGLNTLYGLYIEYYLPNPDPITAAVTHQVAGLLSVFDSSIMSQYLPGSRNIAIDNSHGRILLVFEGCNGVNVMIVFLAFVMAYRGPLRLTVKFTATGLLFIHILNLGRVGALYGIALYFPQYLYFFHKYLLTGVLYAIVFIMWYDWVKRVQRATP